MLVSDYRVYIAPNTNTKKIQPSTKEATTKEKDFSLTSKSTQPKQNFALQKQFPIDYISSNKNLYVNRFKLQEQQPKESQKQEQNKTNSSLSNVEKFQTLSKLDKIPTAYSVPFTSFKDLTKPKHVISSTPNYNENTQYEKLKKESAKKLMTQTYIANDLYYKRTSA